MTGDERRIHHVIQHYQGLEICMDDYHPLIKGACETKLLPPCNTDRNGPQMTDPSQIQTKTFRCKSQRQDVDSYPVPPKSSAAVYSCLSTSSTHEPPPRPLYFHATYFQNRQDEYMSSKTSLEYQCRLPFSMSDLCQD